MAPRIPLPSEGASGESNEHRATATCYCGAIQLSFPVQGRELIDTFICHCTDCRKITASMFASNFIVTNRSLQHVRGRDKLTLFAQDRTIATGNVMENAFCSICGSLMYRTSNGFPGTRILRIGTVDDFNLHETKLKPRLEQFTRDRVCWLQASDNLKQVDGNHYGGKPKI